MDDITNKLLVGADYETTKSAILGPFFREDAPLVQNGGSIIKTMPPDGEVTFMHGIVTDAETKKPIEGITVDIWQCSTNGYYEQQDEKQAEFNLRGKLTTDKDGYYGVYCLRPVPYPVPDDGEYSCEPSQKVLCITNMFELGPGGKLLQLMDRHPHRPAHIHLIVSTTDIFQSAIFTQTPRLTNL